MLHFNNSTSRIGLLRSPAEASAGQATQAPQPELPQAQSKQEEIRAWLAEHGAPGQNALPYLPPVKNNADLDKEVKSVFEEIARYDEEGNTTLTARLALLVSDIIFLGTPSFRSSVDDAEGLYEVETAADGSVVQKPVIFTPEGIKRGDGKFVTLHAQVSSYIRGRYRDEMTPTTTSMLPLAIKRGILVLYGLAQVAYFQRARKGGTAIARHVLGIPLDKMPSADPADYAKAVAAKSRILAPTIWDTKPVKGGERMRDENTARPNTDDALMFLSNDEVTALYALHFEGAKESDVFRDLQGFVTKLNPKKRQPAGATAQTTNGKPANETEAKRKADETVAQAKGDYTPMLDHIPDDQVQAWLKGKAGFDSSASLVSGMLNGLVAALDWAEEKNRNRMVQPWLYHSVATLAFTCLERMLETYDAKNPPSFETARAFADLASDLEHKCHWVGEQIHVATHDVTEKKPLKLKEGKVKEVAAAE